MKITLTISGWIIKQPDPDSYRYRSAYPVGDEYTFSVEDGDPDTVQINSEQLREPIYFTIADLTEVIERINR